MPLAFTATATDANGDLVLPLVDFGEFNPDAPEVLFRNPDNSSTTQPYVDAHETNYTAVTEVFPGSPDRSRVLKVTWAFTNGSANPWLRLTTSQAPGLPNPVVNLRRSLRFAIHSDRALKICLGLRARIRHQRGGAVCGRTRFRQPLRGGSRRLQPPLLPPAPDASVIRGPEP